MRRLATPALLAGCAVALFSCTQDQALACRTALTKIEETTAQVPLDRVNSTRELARASVVDHLAHELEELSLDDSDECRSVAELLAANHKRSPLGRSRYDADYQR